MTKECYLKAKEIIEHDENYSASKISFAYKQIEKWEFANQRVIEVLEDVEDILNSENSGLHIEQRVREVLRAIKELKQ